VGGGFNITITGTLEDDNLATGGVTLRQGTVSCTTQNFTFVIPPPENVNEAEIEAATEDD
jgi:hypothetical protein